MVRLAEELVTLDPRDADADTSQGIAPRLDTLDGKIIGLLSNNKPNSVMMLGMVGDLIREKYAVKEIIEANKGTHRLPAPSEMIDDLASRCDAIITATAE